MCFSTSSPSGKPLPSGPLYFSSRLNDSTYLVVQRDKYREFPFIYVKVYQQHSLAVIIDTGCGARNGDGGGSSQELRDFILTDVLGSGQDSFNLLIVCTHCHFDHIGGIEAFSNSGASIIVSGFDRDFLSPEHLENHSLCGVFGTATPNYTISHYAGNGETLKHQGHDLGLRIIHTPGHTPDSMAIYDQKERWLFVGDTCYQRRAMMPWGEKQDVPIILPLQGNWNDFLATLGNLREFVAKEEELVVRDATKTRIQLAAGHTTSQAPAGEFLRSVVEFCENVASGKVPVVERIPGDVIAPGGSFGDEVFFYWVGTEETGLSLRAPEKLLKNSEPVG